MLDLSISNLNRVLNTGFSYDAGGNSLSDGSYSYSYDAENRMKTGAGVTYTYDGDGKRVQKSSGKLYWYGIGSDPLAESDAAGNVTDEYIFFNAKRVARVVVNQTINAIVVRFSNDSCSGCGGTPVGGGDRNLFVNSITVGSTVIYPNDPSISYTNAPCNRTEGSVGILACSGDMIATNPGSGEWITVSAYGSPDYDIYPHMQLFVNGVMVGEWDVTGTAQNYTASAGAVQYYFSDHLGSSRVITTATGQILDDSDFYPFGGERPVVSSTDNNYLFTGKERDSESNLDYFLARHYASNLGRFLQPDPLIGILRRPQSLNRYSYVLNNPLQLIDPSGLFPELPSISHECPGNLYCDEPKKEKEKIAVDPGHGDKLGENKPVDPGAVSPDGTVLEKDLTLGIANEIQKELKASGVEVVLTRTGDIADPVDRLTWRVELAHEQGAEAFVSVHVDAGKNPDVSGLVVYYRAKDDASMRLAQAIAGANAVFGSTRTRPSDFQVLREFRGTAVLVEAGFITNKTDLKNLQTRTPEIGKGIATGIKNYLDKDQ
jgi:RHS repeat-associated protein